MLNELSNGFIRNILGLHEIEGARWIIGLPKIVKEIEQNWALRAQKPFADLSYHFVAPCVLDDRTEAVLKIAAPQANSPIFNERKLLGIFNGEGAARVLRFDESRLALLLEKLSPGETLVKMCRTDDAKATSIAIGVMRRLLTKTARDGDFPSLENWVGGLRKAENTLFPQTLFKKAWGFFEDLPAISRQRFLLHGDLHHQNILSAGRESYLAIDPKGVIGDIGFEISTFLNNPRGWLLTHPDPRAILKNRLAQFSEAFEIEPLILRKWAFAEAVLSAWWTFEENREDWQKWTACADIWEI